MRSGFSLCLLVAAAFAVSACVPWWKKSGGAAGKTPAAANPTPLPPGATPEPTPEPARRAVGRVVAVDRENHFVLLETGGGTFEFGTVLMLRRDGAEVGAVAVSNEQHRQFVTADIVTGEPEPGDDAVLKTVKPDPTPSPTPKPKPTPRAKPTPAATSGQQ